MSKEDCPAVCGERVELLIEVLGGDFISALLPFPMMHPFSTAVHKMNVLSGIVVTVGKFTRRCRPESVYLNPLRTPTVT